MRKLACVIIVLLALMCSTINVNQNVFATEVIGVIASDTTWTKISSPYILTGPVAVNQGATLTIEPGVTVNFGTYYIQVNGTLKAQGTNQNKIQFTADGSVFPGQVQFMNPSTDWDEQAKTGSIIENAASEKASIFILDSSPKISQNTFNGAYCAINIGSGSPLVSSNQVYCPNTGFGSEGPGIACHGSPTALNNYIIGDGRQIGMTASHTAYLANNEIINCSTGIKATDTATLIGNKIKNSAEVGITCETSSITIQQNFIDHAKYGVVNCGALSKNTITNTEIAIKEPSSSAIISYNNIVNCSQNSIYLSTSSNIEASNNWWGTTDIQTINNSIRDYKKDFNLGKVNFEPFLTTPVDINDGNPLPTISPTPTTSTPQSTNSPLPTTTMNQSSFHIDSNSTVSAFSFNNAQPEISFTVTGPDNTVGYVKLLIAKAFMPNADAIKVYLDGNQIDYSIESTEGSWKIEFTYNHSTHQVVINSITQSTENTSFPSWFLDAVTIAIVLVAVAIAGLGYWLTRKKSKINKQ